MDLEKLIDGRIGDGMVRMGEMTEEQVRLVLKKQKDGDTRLFGEIASGYGFHRYRQRNQVYGTIRSLRLKPDDIRKLLDRMSLEQKASLCSGKDFWHLKGFADSGIPSIMITDGPSRITQAGG